MTTAAGPDGLVFRQDYFDDPAGWQAIADLLRDVFGVDISPLDLYGGHDTSNLPSAYFDEAGRCIANFSAFSMPLRINGRQIRAAGLQSGAVRPEFRGRGLFRALTRTTIDRCDALGYEALALYTDKPGIYTPYGFQVVPQFDFVGPPPPVTAPMPARSLDTGNRADMALVERLLAERCPVSDRFAVAGQAKMFLLNVHLVDTRLSFLPVCDAVIAWRSGTGGVFELLDIAGPAIPSLATIIAALQPDTSKVQVLFPPDRLGWDGEALRDEGDLVFMMRCAAGLLPAGPVCLSPMAEF